METAFALLTIARLEGAIHGMVQGSGIGFRAMTAGSVRTEETAFALPIVARLQATIRAVAS